MGRCERNGFFWKWGWEKEGGGCGVIGNEEDWRKGREGKGRRRWGMLVDYGEMND